MNGLGSPFRDQYQYNSSDHFPAIALRSRMRLSVVPGIHAAGASEHELKLGLALGPWAGSIL